jgi:ubiquitin carboxyl-terminal hydrolase 6/32
LSTRRARDFVKLLSQNSVFLLEIQDQDGGWPLFELYEEEMAQYRQAQNQEESTTSSTPNRRNSTTTPRKQRVRPPGSLLGPTKSQRGNGHGLVGLDNLGNTCYMSSALQCLSHTRLLCEYFQGNAYLRDINLVNRDGTEGRLAIAFGQLVCTLWSSHKSRFAPSDFKAVLSKYNRQFVGSDQHDAQELLAFLLSGLSEDLNRIVKKPYIEQPDSDGRCDRIVAEEWWQNHLKREVSVIVALFTGQYKSLLECATCHYESARFEPFTFLQLPLPESHFRTIQVTIIYRSSQVPLKTSIRLLANGRLFHLKEAIVRKIMSTSESNTEFSLEILLAKTTIYHTIESLLEEDNLPLYCIKEKDILTAFELDSMVDTTLSTTTTEVVHGKEEEEIQNGMTVQLKTISATNDKKYHSSHSIGKKDFEWARVLDIREAKQHPGIKLYDLVFPNGHKRYNVARHRFQVLDKKHPFFCYFVHRRVEKVHTAWFSNAHVTRLFGVPLVIRVSKAMTTPYDLYVYIWNRLKRIFNWSQVPSPMEEHPKTAPSCDLSDLALGTHLLHTRFGFCLRYVTSSGSGCSRCEWIQGCLGCLILPSRIQKLEISAEETIAIDWDITTLKEEYDPVQASQLEVDSSLEIHVKLDNLPLSLDRCLSIFTAKEKIQEAFCGRCKRLQPATKKMDLWRLPPLLVIHLKRFCYTQTTRKKLLNFVDFPLEGLNLDAFMAKQREPRRQSDWIHQTGLSYWLFLGGKLNKHAQLQQRHNEVNSSLPLEEDVEYAAATEAAAATTNGFSGINTGDRLFSDQTSLYDLYAVVNHVGALGTGHYFAYIRSESDGKWKCFNDEQVKDIEPQKVVSSSAYILFYRRRDLQDVSIHELFPPLPPPPPVSAAVQTAGEKNLQFIKNSPNSTPSFSCASIETRTGLSDEQIEQLLEETTKNSSGTSSSCTIT